MHHVSDDFLCETSISLGKIHTNTLETHHWQIIIVKTKLKGDIYANLYIMIYLLKHIIISSCTLN